MTLMKKLFFCSVLSAATCFSYAKNFGVYGELWPLAETSLLKLIESKAAGLDTDDLASKWQNKARLYADHPKPLSIKRATQSKSHHYTPLASSSRDVTDVSGRIIVAQGMSVNVLRLLPDFNPELVFFNADDKAEILWALKMQKKLSPNARFILTGGSLSEAEALFKSPVYFDQKGVICKKFAITQMPAFVKRDGMSLLINEPVIGEDGNEI